MDEKVVGLLLPEIRDVVREIVHEIGRHEQAKAEPAYKTELLEERKRREQLEKRLNEMAEENTRSRQAAAEAERGATIRSELQRLGVGKVDLAYKAVQDSVVRLDDGRLVARSESGETSLREYLKGFVNENPEFLPARIPGGSGSGANTKAATSGGIDIDKIRPGMSPEEMDRARQEIVRVASQTLKGL